VLNCVLNARLAGFPHQAGVLPLLLFPSPGTKDCLPFGIDSLPPEQKVGGSNPLGRTITPFISIAFSQGAGLAVAKHAGY
jgi:hypothetical protein